MTQLLAEIKALGYTGSQNLLYRYINQGRVEADRLPISPRRLAELMMSHPTSLTSAHRDLVNQLTDSCGEITALAGHIHKFAVLLRPDPGNAELLDDWITTVRAEDLPRLHAFIRGIDQNKDAVNTALTLPYHNGRTEGVNTKTKLLKRQMYGRAGFELLRHRILLSGQTRPHRKRDRAWITV